MDICIIDGLYFIKNLATTLKIQLSNKQDLYFRVKLRIKQYKLVHCMQ